MSAAPFTYPNVELLIDGVWRPGAEGLTIPVVDPATDEQIGVLARATRPDLDAALAAAEKGFAAWSKQSAYNRARTMRKAAEIFRAKADYVAWLITREQGKPLGEAKGEVLNGADIIEWFSEEGRRAYGQVIPARAPNVLQTTVKLPVGPVAAFTPWNFPINQLVRKVSAALTAGCSVIAKAAEETPAAPAELLKAFVEAGVPAGVINLVYGVPSEISEYLIPHPIIQKISFTGSTAVGKHLAALAGQHMKRATMELGGHAPVIVCADADMAHAGKTSVGSKYRNAGQVCVAPTRYLVEKPVFGDFLERFVEGAKAVRVGSGLELHDPDGPARQRAPHPVPAIADRRRGVERRGAEDRRRPHRQQGQFHGADRARQCAAGGAHHERGAVRAGRDRQPDRTRSTPRSRRRTVCPTASRPMASPGTAPTSSASAWKSKPA